MMGFFIQITAALFAYVTIGAFILTIMFAFNG